MKEKIYTLLLVVLAVLLVVSIFFNGWLMYEKTAQTAPENIPGFEGGEPCKTNADCPSSRCGSCNDCKTSASVEDCKSRGGGCCLGGGLPF